MIEGDWGRCGWKGDWEWCCWRDGAAGMCLGVAYEMALQGLTFNQTSIVKEQALNTLPRLKGLCHLCGVLLMPQ